MYCKVTSILSSEVIEVREYHPAQYGAPGKKRKKKRFLTPEAVKRQNQKNTIRKIQNIMISNFDNGYHLILRYTKDPKSYEEAEDNLRTFRMNTSRSMREKGRKFHYIAVTERGKERGHLHHHVIIQNLEDFNVIDECNKNWSRFGTITIHPMSKDLYGKDYKDLAAYILKYETKEECKGVRYHISRGLKKPVEHKEKHYGEIKEPQPPKGWFVDPASIITGINPYTGKKYQRYYLRTTPIEEIIKEKEPEKPKKKMKDVSIYIEAEVSGGHAKGIYIVEFIKANGETVTKHKISSGEFSRQSISLRALIGAVSILKKPANIKVYTSNTVIRNAIKNGWIQKWKSSGWKNNKGAQINCAGLWQYLDKICQDHELTAAGDNEKNAYHNWAIDELAKSEERRARA